MALKKTVDMLIGFQAVDAYHRVECVSIDTKTTMSFRVRTYKDGSNSFPAFDDKGYSCAYDMSGTNPIAQAYEFIKTKEEFQGAEDA